MNESACDKKWCIFPKTSTHWSHATSVSHRTKHAQEIFAGFKIEKKNFYRVTESSNLVIDRAPNFFWFATKFYSKFPRSNLFVWNSTGPDQVVCIFTGFSPGGVRLRCSGCFGHLDYNAKHFDLYRNQMAATQKIVRHHWSILVQQTALDWSF